MNEQRRKRSYDVRKEYKRNTVADASFVDFFAKPGDKRCTCAIAGNDYDAVEPEHLILTGGCGISERAAVSEKEVITDSSYNSYNNGYYSGYEIHLLFVVLCKLAELGENNSKKLNDN